MSGKISFITGGAGFIGSRLAEKLTEKGHQVIVYDNLSSGDLKNLSEIKSKIKIVKGDISDFKKLKQAMRGADYVYHHAALVSVAQSMQEPVETHKINIEGTANVLEAARLNGVKRVLLASSSAVYGNGKDIPYKEASPTDCRSPYAASKLIGEELLKCYFKAYGLETVCVRYFNVFGPKQNPNSPYAAVIAKFMDLAKRGDAFFIDWDGKQSRDFVFIDDVADATILAMEKGKAGEVYNVASGKTYSLRDLAREIETVAGKKMKRVFKPKRAGDIKKSAADIAKITKLGYKAKTSLKEGLKEIFKA